MIDYLVGVFFLALWKMMEWKSVGMMKFPINMDIYIYMEK